jgi:hypothetical protein
VIDIPTTFDQLSGPADSENDETTPLVAAHEDLVLCEHQAIVDGRADVGLPDGRG